MTFIAIQDIDRKTIVFNCFSMQMELFHSILAVCLQGIVIVLGYYPFCISYHIFDMEYKTDDDEIWSLLKKKTFWLLIEFIGQQ